jgi:hypothetical protein
VGDVLAVLDDDVGDGLPVVDAATH